ncbi:conserved membrane hypothetical protein [uncultured Mycobacterium sp.]|uniref:DUF2637 domain-containing protein n=1 Tax=uncultured Mycobacterium sp. TaxID=171292 RepID=A0A1Y5PD59_9MYCO|nr:conserved membrane hypothetical protein [uncultured Mycobacterium sp.]
MRATPPTTNDHAAAWSTMRADRRFLWFWLTVATTLSVGGNVGHAWLTVEAAASRGMAIGWAAAPPALLMLAIHGLPTLGRMLGSEERDRLLTCVVWGVTVGAFGWSAFGIFGFTTAMGVPEQMAWVAPFVIDLSVFGATRGLVLTAPLAARMKAAMDSAVIGAAPAANTTVSDTVGNQPAVVAIATPTASTEPTPDDQSARAESASPTAGPIADAPNDAPADNPTESTPPVVSGTRELAEHIVAAGAVRKPVETVVAILSAAEREPRKAVIAEHTGVHHSVVTKTLEAAESYRRKSLAAVG